MTKQQGKPLVSGSGLTPGDRKLLADCLAQIDLILETPHLMGAHEADQGFALQRRLKSRLTPEGPATLAGDATDSIRLFGPSIAGYRKQLKANEEARAAYDAADAARRAARNADIAAKLEAAEQKRKAAVLSAQEFSRGRTEQ